MMLLIIALWFPHTMLVHCSSGIVLVGMAIMLGRTVTNTATAIVALLTAATFISAGILANRYGSAADVVYFIGVGAGVLRGYILYVALLSVQSARLIIRLLFR
jgi:hypothetical protein